MSSTRRGLGRGLDALITADSSRPPDRTGGVLEVPVHVIAPNPLQPRQGVDSEALKELAESIREHGVIQPLIVVRCAEEGREDGKEYQLVAGERRWRAAQLAGLTAVPVLVKEATSQQQLEWALVENLQRADLNPLETANAYHLLMKEFKLTQEQVADQVGKSRTAVANSLRLLRLPDELKVAILSGEISEGHARALQGLPTSGAQVAGLATVRRRSLSVRQTEELVRRTLARVGKSAREREGEEDISQAWKLETQALEGRFRTALGTKVALTRSARGGKLIVSFYSEEELQHIYELIVGEE
ncbi:MAG TPA: ParB/RepB/Spo0J family partition protein [Anaerolineae bacterium]|nr:ParB/RepB/Spo0J family partition protein [Anaerolineae bacterium]